MGVLAYGYLSPHYLPGVWFVPMMTTSPCPSFRGLTLTLMCDECEWQTWLETHGAEQACRPWSPRHTARTPLWLQSGEPRAAGAGGAGGGGEGGGGQRNRPVYISSWHQGRMRDPLAPGLPYYGEDARSKPHTLTRIPPLWPIHFQTCCVREAYGKKIYIIPPRFFCLFSITIKDISEQ